MSSSKSFDREISLQLGPLRMDDVDSQGLVFGLKEQQQVDNKLVHGVASYPKVNKGYIYRVSGPDIPP